jgi:hypothetical protein
MLLSISPSVYRHDLKTSKKQYKNILKLIDIEYQFKKKGKGSWEKTQKTPN